MKNPFPPINYPPGVSDSTYNAPWNEVDLIATCYECGEDKKAEDLFDEELKSYEDNDDGTFLCDTCAENDEDED